MIQDIFVALLRSLRAFDYNPNGSFRGWLREVAFNKWRETRRRSAGVAQLDSAELSQLPQPSCPDAFEEQEYRRYLVHRAWELIQTDFEPMTRTAFWKTVLHDRPVADVARELGVSLAVVYSAKSRVLQRLRYELQGLLD